MEILIIIPICWILFQISGAQNIYVTTSDKREKTPDIEIRRIHRPLPLRRHNVMELFLNAVPCFGDKLAYCNFQSNNNYKIDATNYFPQGIIKDHSFDCAFRINSDNEFNKLTNSWNLINIDDLNNGNQFSLRMNPPAKSVEIQRRNNDVVSNLVFSSPEIYDGKWHDLKYNLKNNDITLFIDCKNKPFHIGIPVLNRGSEMSQNAKGVSLVVVQTKVPENVDIMKLTFNSLPIKIPHGIKCPEISKSNKDSNLKLKPPQPHIAPKNPHPTRRPVLQFEVPTAEPEIYEKIPNLCTCNVDEVTIHSIKQSIFDELRSNLTQLEQCPPKCFAANNSKSETSKRPSLDGIPGMPGLKGAKGEPGFKGDAGFPGMPGLYGIPGERGLNGTKGDVGAIGPPGLNGENGEPGVNGLKGVKGDPGVKGYSGLDGVPGYPGRKGEKGDPGSIGLSGQKGEAGIPGRPGLDGTPGSPEKQDSPIDIEKIKMDIIDEVLAYVEQYIETRLSFDFPSEDEIENDNSLENAPISKEDMNPESGDLVTSEKPLPEKGKTRRNLSGV